jgi:hypothetical protein
MDHQQPISGDLHAIQREHSNHSSTASSPPKSLLERRQDDQILDNNITPMPTGIDRMAALKDLGTTFEEGQRRISKVATPTETIVPSFVDSQHLEV